MWSRYSNQEENVLVEKLQASVVRKLNNYVLDIQFQIDFDVLRISRTYIALSLTNYRSEHWIYNDNSMNQLMSGTGHKTVHYTCSLPTAK